jgi:hypothetical protein
MKFSGSFKPRLALTMAVLVLGLISLSTVVQAETKMSTEKTAHSAKVSHSYYVCKLCQVYYSPANAKKLGYKDQMGHKLVKVSKIPAGYGDGMKM